MQKTQKFLLEMNLVMLPFSKQWSPHILSKSFTAGLVQAGMCLSQCRHSQSLYLHVNPLTIKTRIHPCLIHVFLTHLRRCPYGSIKLWISLFYHWRFFCVSNFTDFCDLCNFCSLHSQRGHKLNKINATGQMFTRMWPRVK